MKRISLTLFFCLLSTALWSQSEFFNTVVFRNNTDAEIYYLFFSPADSDYWGPDVLGDSRTLLPGGEVEFFISYPNESDSFDFMAVDERGRIYEIYEELITDGEAAEIVINKKSKSDIIDIEDLEAELISLEILNETGRELAFIFVSPSDSQMYGIDFMDSYTTLPPDDSLNILLFRNDVEIEYDIMAMDEDDNSFSFSLTLDPELENQYVAVEYSDLD